MSSKLAIALGVLVALTGAIYLQFNAENAEDAKATTTELTLPTLEKDKIDLLEIAPAGKSKVVLKHEGDTWRVVEPVDGPASKSAVETALDKLSSIEVTGVAATKANNHERLEVTAEKGVHVIAKNGDALLADLWIGAYRGGSTMVRQEGEERVAAVATSIRYAFDKAVKEWREREVTRVESESLARITLKTPREQVVIVHEGGEWKQPQGEKAIEGFDASKASSLATAIARLTAMDFAGDDVTPESAGTAEGDLARITVEMMSDAGADQVVLKLGKQVDNGYYLQREGHQEIYQVSKFIGDRLSAGSKELVTTEEEKAAAAAAPQGQPGLPEGMQGMIPPNMLPQHMAPPPGH